MEIPAEARGRGRGIRLVRVWGCGGRASFTRGPEGGISYTVPDLQQSAVVDPIARPSGHIGRGATRGVRGRGRFADSDMGQTVAIQKADKEK